jgi:hypothetical protein
MNVVNMGSDPYGVEEGQLANRLRLAQLIQSQAMDNQPVYSGTAAVAKALMGALGGYEQGQAEKGQRELASRKEANRQAEIDSIFKTVGGGDQAYIPASGVQKDDNGNPMPGSAAASPANPRLALARLMARSTDPNLAQTGLAGLLKGPDAPIVKEVGDSLYVLSPDGRTVISKFGGGKIAPPNIADATPESLAAYQQSGDASVLKPRIKQVAVDTGGGTAFVNPEAPPTGVIPKTMSPGETAVDQRDRARLRFEGVDTGPGVIPPAVQAARDDGRMKILLEERAKLAATGQTDPALEREIQLTQRSAAPRAQGGAAPGLAPKGQQAVAQATAEGLNKGGVDYKNSLDERVRSGADLMMRVNEAQQALEQFKPGMGAESRLNVARAAQAIGLPDDLVKRINAGDISAKQEFMKLSAQQAMESLKQSMGGAGRIAQAEFKVFQQNNPNIELDPAAINKIFNFSRQVFVRDQKEQQGLTDYIGQGGQISQWPTVWTQQQMKEGLMSPKPSGGGKTVVRTGTLNGRKVVQYSDGTTDYAP